MMLPVRSGYLMLPFCGGGVERGEKERHVAGFLNRQLDKEKRPRVVICKDNLPHVFLDKLGNWLHPVTPFLSPVLQAEDTIYVGKDVKRNAGVFLLGESRVSEDALREGSWVNARSVCLARSEEDLALLGLCVFMHQWVRSCSFCPSCGGGCHMKDYGVYRQCAQCGKSHYPQLSSAIIVAVLDGQGNVILGQHRTTHHGDKKLRTILAGYVSPGESIEETVVREVKEESNAEIRSLRYVSSQFWPFANTLMLCFYAVADYSTPLVADKTELESVSWTSKEDVRKALKGEHPELELPPSFTASNVLLSRWVDGLVNDHGNDVVLS